MADIVNYKCKECGAPLRFDPKSGKMLCDYCGSSFTMEEARSEAEAEAADAASSDMLYSSQEHSQVQDEEGHLKGYTCPSCGAEMSADENTAATQCPYCGNQTVVSSVLEGVGRPELMIPFSVDKDRAKGALLDFCKGKFLLPKDFRDSNKINNINGIYAPFWLYDCEAEGSALYNAKKEKRDPANPDKYRLIEHYKVERQGSMAFEKVPVDASTRMDDAYMDALEPFDLNGVVDYDGAYFAGYLASKYDVSSADCQQRMERRVDQSMKSQLRSTVTGYDSVMESHANVSFNKVESTYAMFPIWMFSSKYNGEVYTFAMNGQTGKVAGRLPIDKGRYALFFSGMVALFFAISQILIFSGIIGSKMDRWKIELICLAVSALLGFLCASVAKSGMNTAVMKKQANDYAKKDTFNLSKRRDSLVNVERIVIEQKKEE